MSLNPFQRYVEQLVKKKLEEQLPAMISKQIEHMAEQAFEDIATRPEPTAPTKAAEGYPWPPAVFKQLADYASRNATVGEIHNAESWLSLINLGGVADALSEGSSRAFTMRMEKAGFEAVRLPTGAIRTEDYHNLFRWTGKLLR